MSIESRAAPAGARPADEQLARRAAGGDRDAFSCLYERYERRVFGLCLRITASPDDAADAAQETFVKLLEKLPRNREPVRDFGAYALAVARNASLDLLARRRRADPVEEPPEPPPERVEPPSPEDDPERATLLDSARVSIAAANARLDPRHREVLALREAEELSYDEIATVMEMNRNAVAQLILRARAALRRELRHDAATAIVPAGRDCERALPLVSARQDGERVAGVDADWLDAHLRGCPRCRLAGEELADVGRSYRAWAPLPAAAGLEELVTARVADAMGFDWAEGIGSTSGAATAGAGKTSALIAHKGLAAIVATAVVAVGGVAVVATVSDEPSAPPGRVIDAVPATADRAADAARARRASERRRARAQRRRVEARRERRARLAPAQPPAAPAPATPAPAAPAPAPPTAAPPAAAPEPPIAPELEVSPE